MDEATVSLPGASVNVCLFDNDRIRLVRYRQHPLHPADPQKIEEIYNSPNLENVDAIRRNRIPLIIPDTRLDPNWAYHEYTIWIRSFLSLPLIFDDQIIGMLNFDGDEPGIFSADDTRRMEAFARAAAIALHNARLVEQYQRSLQEKETLLREVYHRVDNNLNVITSLLSLQLEQTTPQTNAKTALEQIRDRIYSIALVHEGLFESPSLTAIDMNEYARSLTAWLLSNHQSGSRITPRFCEEHVALDIHHALPCGLIMNELVSNALLHAFPDGRAGTVRICVRPDETNPRSAYLLEVADDGAGLPRFTDVTNPQTLGFQMVRILVDQIHGRLDLSKNGETRFSVHFPRFNTAR